MNTTCRNSTHYLTFIAICFICFFPLLLQASPGNYTQELTADFPQALADFGQATALSEDGKTLVVGAPGDDTFGADAGAVFIFELQAGAWVQVDKIYATDPDPLDCFGDEVAIYGNRLVVGAFGDDEGALGAGAAYVFEKQGQLWNQTAKILSSNPQEEGRFGRRVNVSAQDRIYVSSREDNGEGAVAIYELVLDTWEETIRLKASDAEVDDAFGSALGLDPAKPDRLIVGATLGDSPVLDDTGAVYVFDFDGLAWNETDKLTASDGEFFDQFGISVDLNGDTLVVGAPNNSEVNVLAGAAYVFEDQGGTWNEVAKLTDPAGMIFDGFGVSVSISGSRILVGTFTANAAFVFEDIAGTWTQIQKIENIPNTSALGLVVAIEGSTLIIGDPFATVSGLTDAGLVYVQANAPEVTVVSTITETTLTINDADGLSDLDLAGLQVTRNGQDITTTLISCVQSGTCPREINGNTLTITIPRDLTNDTLVVTISDQQGYRGQGSN